MIILTHINHTGPPQELRDFLLKKERDFCYIEHPFPHADLPKSSKLMIFKSGQTAYHRVGWFAWLKVPALFFYIKDFFYTLWFLFLIPKGSSKSGVCIAADTLNAFSALVAKKLRMIDQLIYWTIDYTPQRFQNPVLNGIYHWMDRRCCYSSSFLWNSSARMKEARRSNGVNLAKCAPEIIVEDGCHFNEISKFKSITKEPRSLVFMGHLTPNKGVDLILEAMPLVLHALPDTRLTIVGKGPELPALKTLAKSLKIDTSVVFTGYIESHTEVERIISAAKVAIAPYVPDKNSFTFFSDIGKVKVYLACGLPVIITAVPEIAQKIQNEKAGLICEYSKEDLATKILAILANPEIYTEMKKNALELARDMDWDNIWTNVLRKTGADL